MGLKGMMCALQAEVRSSKHKMKFEEAKTRHATLVPYALPISALAILEHASRHYQGQKDAITLALVAEQRDQPHPFWAAMLLVAYAPMLNRLRGRLVSATAQRDDLDQLVVTSFLQVIATFPRTRAPGHTCVFLRQATERRVFDRLRDDREDYATVELVEPDHLAATVLDGDQILASAKVRAPRSAREVEELVALLVEVAGGAVKPAHLALVVDTMIRGERLPAYVGRVYPELAPGEHRRLYERLKRQRSRTISRLRKPLTALCTAAEGEEVTE
jgi:hypothetical protein